MPGDPLPVVSMLFVVATNANAAAPDINVIALATRRLAWKRFRLNQRLDFIDFIMLIEV